MRRGIVVLAALCLVFALIPVVGGCHLWPVVRGSGETVEQSYEFSGFTRISTGWAFNITVTEAKSYAVTVSTDDNLQEYLDVYKDGDTLYITLKQGHTYSNTHLRAEVKLPRLLALSLSGASTGSVSGFDTGDDFRLEVSGASHATLSDMTVEEFKLEASGASRAGGSINAAGDARFEASGASTIELSGGAEDADIRVSGASTVDLEAFLVRDADAEVSGASNATVNASGTLSAEVSGASHLYYTGSPKLGDIDVSGASSIDKK